MSRTVLALTVVTALVATFARAADVELLGQPCRTRQIIGSALVTDRQDGRERMVLLNDNENSHCEVLYIDFEKDEVQVYPAPAGAGAWAAIEVPGDLFVIGTFYDAALMAFDLKTKTFTKVTRFAGEEYIWQLARGTDGRLYGGTYPGGKLGALDLQTWKVEDLGNPAKPNQYCRNVAATPWGQIVATFGMVASTTKVYDIKSKQWGEFPGLPPKGSVHPAVTWKGYFVARDPRSGRIEAFEDASFKPADPSPLPPLDSTYVLEPQLCSEQRLCLRQGRSLFEVATQAGKPALRKLAQIDVDGADPVGITKSGSVVGYKGQGYFVAGPDGKFDLRSIKAEAQPRPMLFIKGGPDGRIWGGPHFGQTLCHYDIRTGEAVNTDVVCDSGGEVYDVAFAGGRVYAASYAGGDISEYAPSKPWDQLHHVNPRPIARFSRQGYIRPVAGIRAGPDGKLYAAWIANYGTYGGAVSITDPAAGKNELIENPLGKQAVHSLAVDAKNIYVGTSLEGNGLPHQKGQAQFGVIDLTSRKVVFQKSYPAAAVGRLCCEPKTGTVLFTVGSRLYAYSPATKEIAESPVPNLPAITGDPLLAPGDGTLLVAGGSKILRVDPTAKAFSTFVEAPAAPECMTLGSDRKLYFKNGPNLYRVNRGVDSKSAQ